MKKNNKKNRILLLAMLPFLFFISCENEKVLDFIDESEEDDVLPF